MADEEYTDLRADRFERKGPHRKNRQPDQDAAIAAMRGNESGAPAVYRVMLHAVPFDHIKTFHNLEAFPYGFGQDKDIVAWAGAMASDSPTARILLKEAQAEGWGVALGDLGQSGYVIDEDAQTIFLDHYGFTAQGLGRSSYFRNALFVSFVRALRQIWHDRQGHGFEASHRPDAILMLERARAADCETIAILVGWELRAAGHNDLWRYILGSEEGDMAMIFTRAIEKDPAGFYDGSVLTRAFCQWYGDDSRVAACDHAALEQMDDRLQAGADAEEFGKGPLRGSDIEKLSRLPGGRAYLSGMGANIAADPYFVALNDPINEAHLFQIAYDSKVIMAGGVPFRDQRLARLIFPALKVGAED